jgi:hypothetical protein
MLAASLEILERAQVPPLQARAIVQAIELELIAQQDVLATKQDVALLRHDFSEFRHENTRGHLELRRDLELKIEQVRSDLVRWVFTVGLGQTAAVCGLAYFLAEHLKR